MTKKLFVGGLSWDTGDAQFKTAFQKFGTVAEARVILDQETGRSRGFGFVTFSDDEAGTRALQEMDGAELDGRVIRVNEAQERSARPPGDRGSRPPRPSHSSGGAPRSSDGRSSFRSEDRQPAGRGGAKRRGRPGEGRGEDRFGRRRNNQQGKRDSRESGGFGEDSGYETDDE